MTDREAAIKTLSITHEKMPYRKGAVYVEAPSEARIADFLAGAAYVRSSLEGPAEERVAKGIRGE